MNEKPNDFFKRLWAVLDRLEDKDKATLVGNLFHALVKGQIDVNKFLRLCNVIEGIFYDDLRYMHVQQKPDLYSKEEKEKYDFPDEQINIKLKLANFGLMDQIITTEGGGNAKSFGQIKSNESIKPKFKYTMNRLGLDLIKYGFEKSDEKPKDRSGFPQPFTGTIK